MDKNVEIFFSYAENKDVSILVVVQVLVVVVREMTLKEASKEIEKYHNGEGFRVLIRQENLERVERNLKGIGCNYRVTYMGMPGEPGEIKDSSKS